MRANARRRQSAPVSAGSATDDDEGDGGEYLDAGEQLAALNEENDELHRRVGELEDRLEAVFSDAARVELELSGKNEALDKLRDIVALKEKERREWEKRYGQQNDNGDRERKAWQDEEQHLKLRIQALTASVKARKDAEREAILARDQAVHESEAALASSTSAPNIARPPAQEPAVSAEELAALQAHLDSLTTAHASLSDSHASLLEELSELRKINSGLQDENESYQVLLGEKTLSGEVRGLELMREWGERRGSVFFGQGDLNGLSDEDDDDDDQGFHSPSLEGLGAQESEDEQDVDALLSSRGVGSSRSGAVAASTSPPRPKARKSPDLAKADSSGLDLAAELDQAAQEQEEEAKRLKEEEEEEEMRRKRRQRREKSLAVPMGSPMAPGEADLLKTEIQALKEANKALTLYVSKIVDRVCSQEGFEKVLAVDYKLSPPMTLSSPQPKGGHARQRSANFAAPPSPRRTNFADGAGTGAPPLSGISARARERTTSTISPSSSSASMSSALGASSSSMGGGKGRMSLDWKSLPGIFSGALAPRSPPAQPSPSSLNASMSSSQGSGSGPGFRPFMLDPSQSRIGSGGNIDARRLSYSGDDEEDMKERERLRKDLLDHGIDLNSSTSSSLAARGRASLSNSTSSEASAGPTLVLEAPSPMLHQGETSPGAGGQDTPLASQGSTLQSAFQYQQSQLSTYTMSRNPSSTSSRSSTSATSEEKRRKRSSVVYDHTGTSLQRTRGKHGSSSSISYSPGSANGSSSGRRTKPSEDAHPRRSSDAPSDAGSVGLGLGGGGNTSATLPPIPPAPTPLQGQQQQPAESSDDLASSQSSWTRLKRMSLKGWTGSGAEESNNSNP